MMETKQKEIPASSHSIYQKVRKLLTERGVTIRDIAELTYSLQKKHLPKLTIEDCEISIEQVLKKREVQNAILTGIQLDILAEQKLLFSPLQEMIERDEGLYGIDEILSISIANIYGSIGITNYGYIDKLKPGVLKRLDHTQDGEIHTFLDDLVGAMAAAASARLAHNNPQVEI